MTRCPARFHGLQTRLMKANTTAIFSGRFQGYWITPIGITGQQIVYHNIVVDKLGISTPERGELTAWGLVTSDSYQGLRTLITPQQIQRRRSRRIHREDQLAAAGRWSLLRPHADPEAHDYNHSEHIAHVLLRRYGVVFRKLLERESGLPPWRELLYIYRRMEARGELRGGRFVQGFAGEQ